MSANLQTAGTLGAADLALLLALVRGGSLTAAAQLVGMDASTVFRGVQRAEKLTGQRLFERSRTGYRATELGLRLAQHAEGIEAELEAARGAVRQDDGAAVSGTVRISTTDTLLHGLLMPVLPPLLAAHSGLRIELSARNELVSLTQREADIALRATNKPPPHLVGRALGTIRSAVFGAAGGSARRRGGAPDLAGRPWLAVDDALPEHPSVRWRRRHLPQVQPRLLLNSVHSVAEGVAAGLGIGILPLFLGGRGLRALSEPLPECDNQLWLLTHPESRHLRRIAAVARHLGERIRLDPAGAQ
ncbi:LysR family transcriptional regulator [Roseateles sp. DAIF2]|uniref:LysR family transcriptional regulator n=1 Tax=Roseateles sp. DAIF2 TaxID=2714952 RepID=UPI0018A3394B|nr:LysR family transcriptional regulator [Roseateles sp. DAIF2]QPF71945.1 LysR family transcriptional regulator [Roseateles sp. DAIF2]